jgi:DNA-binding MarR family transcriptional regulator
MFMNQIIDYLKNTIGLDVEVLGNRNIQTGQLPFHLKQGNEFNEVKINGRRLVFVKPRYSEHPVPDQIQQQMEQIKRILQLQPVYLFDKFDTYTRKRLVQNRTAFIVENKQMYIPFLLIDFEEKKTSKEIKEYLTPSAQCILIYHLLVKSLNDCNLKFIAETLTYSKMTITRSVKEIEAFGLCDLERSKDKRVRFVKGAKEIWTAAQEKMKSPVKKRVWVEEMSRNQTIMHGGISALSRYTNISDDRQPTYAINTAVYKQLKRDHKLIAENKKYGQIALEIWKYDPNILSTRDNVDPISLYLSLQTNEDERVQQALEQMINELW